MRLFIFGILLTAGSLTVGLPVFAQRPGFGQKLNPLESLGPDIPTPESVVERMLEVGRVKQIYGAKAVGVELRPDLCEKARERVKSLGLDEKVSIVEGNVLHVDLSAAYVVTMYFLTSSNERLRPNLEHWLKPGARVVSNQFAIKGWKPQQVAKVKAGSMEHTIYVYEIGKNK
jgi:hypothetical protein